MEQLGRVDGELLAYSRTRAPSTAAKATWVSYLVKGRVCEYGMERTLSALFAVVE